VFVNNYKPLIKKVKNKYEHLQHSYKQSKIV